MKKTDITLLFLIVSLSAGMSYWIASSTIGKSSKDPITVKSIEPISIEDVKADPNIFSSEGINPTVDSIISGEDIISFMDESEDSLTDESSDNNEGDSLADDDDNTSVGEGATRPKDEE